MKRLFILVLITLCPHVARCDADGDRAALRRECDELISHAVKRPYGWAWTTTVPDPKPKGGAQPVDLKPPGSAAAGLALYWAGDLLDEPRYKEAALQTARGLMAAQRQTGAVPARPIFLPNVAGGRAEVSLVADRAPTCAAEALWLTLIEESRNDPVLRGSALRAMNWLLRQQSPNGGWMQADPPATQPADAVRLIRLDDGEWRNSTLTILLAHDVMNDLRCAEAVARSNELLLRLRLSNASPKAQMLWATAYGTNLLPANRVAYLPPGVDVLASRVAMQTLLASSLSLGDPPAPAEGPSRALTAAADAAERLPKYDGLWLRIYELEVDATLPPPSSQPAGFERVAPIPPLNQRTAKWGMDRAVALATELRAIGRPALAKRFAASDLTLHQRYAAVICGLSDDPFAKLEEAPEPEVEPTTSDRARHIWRLIRALKQAKA